MDRGAWSAAVHGVAMSRAWLSIIPGFPHPHQTNKKPYQVQHPLLPRAVPLASLTSQSITVCSVWSLLLVTASFALFSSHWSFYCSLSLPKPSPPASSLTPDSALFVFIALHGMVSSGVYLFTVCQPNRTKVPWRQGLCFLNCSVIVPTAEPDLYQALNETLRNGGKRKKEMKEWIIE